MTGSTFTVESMVVGDLGNGLRLYAGGTFTMAGGAPASRIAAWDGVSWTALGSGVSNGISPAIVSALAIWNDGTGTALYVGGFFNTAGGIPANNVAKWNGTVWSPLGAGMQGGPQANVKSLAVFDDGTGAELYAGGHFTFADGAVANNLAKWNGTTWTSVTGGTGSPSTSSVLSLMEYDDGTGSSLYVGGRFTTIGGTPANNIARWDGITWMPLGTGITGSGVLQLVLSMAAFDDGSGEQLYVGGSFFFAGGNAVNHIARWDPTFMTWSSVGVGVNGPLMPSPMVRALRVWDDGTGPALYAGGMFNTANVLPAADIAKWNGSTWSPLGTGVVAGLGGLGSISSMAVFSTGNQSSLVVGGVFTFAGGNLALNVASWTCQGNLSISLSQSGGPGSPISIRNMFLVPGNEYFNIYSVTPCPGAVGSGPFLGLCAPTPAARAFLISQVLLPLGTPAFHFLAAGPSHEWGPVSVPSVTLEAVTIDVTAGVPGTVSAVTRLAVQ